MYNGQVRKRKITMCRTHGSSHLAVYACEIQPSCRVTQQHLVLYKPHRNKFNTITSHKNNYKSIHEIFN